MGEGVLNPQTERAEGEEETLVPPGVGVGVTAGSAEGAWSLSLITGTEASYEAGVLVIGN